MSPNIPCDIYRNWYIAGMGEGMYIGRKWKGEEILLLKNGKLTESRSPQKLVLGFFPLSFLIF